jgi:hypothetical protein
MLIFEEARNFLLAFKPENCNRVEADRDAAALAYGGGKSIPFARLANRAGSELRNPAPSVGGRKPNRGEQQCQNIRLW